jgi:pilus assembly protein Flp/PilA
VTEFITRALLTLRSREEGQTMVEYALILSLVSIAAITTLGLLGTQVDTVFNNVLDALGG